LASSRDTRNSADVRDVISVMSAFQEQNQVRIEMRLELKTDVKGQDIVMYLAAHERGKEFGEAPSLASVSVTCLAMNKASMEACLIHALYVLDFQLALHEWGSADKKSQ
jgi:hypothetical protein